MASAAAVETGPVVSATGMGPNGRLSLAERQRVETMLARDADAADHETKRAVRKAHRDRPARPELYAVPEKDRDKPEGERRFHARDDHVLWRAWDAKKIMPDEFNAGQTYRKLFEKLEARSGVDSTQLIAVTAGGGKGQFGVGWTVEQVGAHQALIRIRANLKDRDWKIVHYFCGEGRGAAEAVLRSTACDRDAVWYRLREALEELVDAIAKAQVGRLV